MDVRQGFWAVLQKYWWLLALILIVGAVVFHVPFFQYILFVVGGFVLLSIFLPIIFQFFSPVFILASLLIEHFRSSQRISFVKKFIFIPLSLLSVSFFIFAQIILMFWVFILAFVVWQQTIGTFFSIFLIFFFGLAPIAIITAPFVLWVKFGLAKFFEIGGFFLMALFWYGLSILSFSEGSNSSTPESFLGYSPQTFLLGALSCQVIALPFYCYKTFNIGDGFSKFGGFAFLLLAVISSINWHLIKRKLTANEKIYIYKPPVWIFILGFLITNIIEYSFSMYQANTVILGWLEGFFFLAILIRTTTFIFKKKVKIREQEI